uniref:glycerophosphocholine phosphodiesterase GPCPD1 isoform X2 n=1 Tax=Myxine glutinosa TaxID=7769 RepID=UPI00358F3DA6
MSARPFVILESWISWYQSLPPFFTTEFHPCSSSPMDLCQVTFVIKAHVEPGDVLAVCGDADPLGNWEPRKAVFLERDSSEEGEQWKVKVMLPAGQLIKFRFFSGRFLDKETQQCIINQWESGCSPRSVTPYGFACTASGGDFGVVDGKKVLDTGWLTSETELRLMLHSSAKPSVMMNNQNIETSNLRVKLSVIGLKDDSPSVKVSMSAFSRNDFYHPLKQLLNGWLLNPESWLEYTIVSLNLCNLQLVLDFEEEKADDSTPVHVGLMPLLSSCIMENGKNQGMLCLPIMKPDISQTIGWVEVHFLIVRPIAGLSLDMSEGSQRHWQPSSPVHIGHRGAGASISSQTPARVRENTISSFKHAAQHGADFVEMDVQLSKDKVPMIYHDLVCPVMIKRHEKEMYNVHKIAIKDFTLDSLHTLQIAHGDPVPENTSADEPDDSFDDVESLFFPPLEKVLQVLPGHVGFNLEIKWPLQSKDGSWDFAFGSEFFFDINEFIDAILHCVFTHACQRRIIFSSFDPDICSVIRRKQNRFPVLFLTQGTTNVYDELMDIRNRSTDIAMHFAQSNNLLGINVHAEDLLRNPGYIKKARTLGFLIFCWGKDTNNLENQRILEREGVHGLVYDKIYEYSLLERKQSGLQS